MLHIISIKCLYYFVIKLIVVFLKLFQHELIKTLLITGNHYIEVEKKCIKTTEKILIILVKYYGLNIIK